MKPCIIKQSAIDSLHTSVTSSLSILVAKSSNMSVVSDGEMCRSTKERLERRAVTSTAAEGEMSNDISSLLDFMTCHLQHGEQKAELRV